MDSTSQKKTDSKKPLVAIIGGGFGGLRAAQALKKAPVEVVLIDRNNYHLFQPLLYQVATAGLSPGEIAQPLRTIFRRQKNFRFRLAEVKEVKLEEKVLLSSTGSISYDYIILAIGSQTTFFGLDSVERNGLYLKDLDNAISIRNQLLSCFELAEQEQDPERRSSLLTFVIVGGGPTGVECAGAISELIRLVLIKDYPDLNFSDVHVLLFEMQDHLLDGFPENLQINAKQELQSKRVEVILGARVIEFAGGEVKFSDGNVVQSETLIWAAGVRAGNLADHLGVKQARQGRITVSSTLQIPVHPHAFVIGDSAYIEEEGYPLPMMAPVAIQQGELAAKNILHSIKDEPLETFTYKDPGSLATIGRNKAVARIGKLKFSGFLAWVVWLVVHIYWLIGFRNRLLVLINWIWDYFSYERAVRLITPYARKH
jgi:NADH dehydrogenase